MSNRRLGNLIDSLMPRSQKSALIDGTSPSLLLSPCICSSVRVQWFLEQYASFRVKLSHALLRADPRLATAVHPSRLPDPIVRQFSTFDSCSGLDLIRLHICKRRGGVRAAQGVQVARGLAVGGGVRTRARERRARGADRSAAAHPTRSGHAAARERAPPRRARAPRRPTRRPRRPQSVLAPQCSLFYSPPLRCSQHFSPFQFSSVGGLLLRVS